MRRNQKRNGFKDGKSPTTWDKWFEMEPELFYDQVGPENTSNTYELYKEDGQYEGHESEFIPHLHRLESFYCPTGKNLNPAVAFIRIISELVDNGVEPIINLFHFDMPWWLMEKRRLEARESVDHFTAYYASVALSNSATS